MNVISKAVASIAPGADDATSEHGTFDVILSAQSEDRDGDTLRSDEWKQPLPDHITFDTDHGMTVSTTIGSGRPFINDDGNLQVEGSYSSIPRAQEVRTLVNEGHIRTTSVAFMTTKTAKANNGKTERELLNGAFVAVPSNRDTVVLSSKALDVVAKVGARNNSTDKQQIQAIHDAASGLGASCSTADAENADDGEQDGANKSADAVAALKAIEDACRANADAIAELKAAADTAKDGEGYQPQPYRQDPDETVVCPACGKRDDTDARFCDQCGVKLAGRDDVKTAAAQDDKPGGKTVTTYVSKALANSVEDLQARISDALSDIYERNNPQNWVWVQATFLDDGGKSGTVVYSLNGDSLSRSFDDDGNQVTLGDKVTDVTIITSVVPEGDGSDSKSVAGAETKAVSDKPWSDFTAADYSLEQYQKATLIHPAEPSEDKGDYKLPVLEPDGVVNRNGVHAAASALAGGRGGVDSPADAKEQAAKKLVGLYRNQLKEDPPASLLELAGEKPQDDTKSADPVAADVKSAAAGSADEDLALRARALLLIAEQRALSL